MIEKEKKKTIRQAWRELLVGCNILENLKFLVIAFFGLLFGLFKKDKA